MEVVFADSIDHQEVNRPVRYPAAAGFCIDCRAVRLKMRCRLWYTSKLCM